jgi:hypothetical protein
LAGADVYQAHNAGVRDAPHDRQLAKILVQSDQHAALSVRAGQDLVVAGIFKPVTRPHDVVAGSLDLSARPALHSSIQEDTHRAASASAGATRSWPTSLRA